MPGKKTPADWPQGRLKTSHRAKRVAIEKGGTKIDHPFVLKPPVKTSIKVLGVFRFSSAHLRLRTVSRVCLRQKIQKSPGFKSVHQYKFQFFTRDGNVSTKEETFQPLSTASQAVLLENVCNVSPCMYIHALICVHLVFVYVFFFPPFLLEECKHAFPSKS